VVVGDTVVGGEAIGLQSGGKCWWVMGLLNLRGKDTFFHYCSYWYGYCRSDITFGRSESCWEVSNIFESEF